MGYCGQQHGAVVALAVGCGDSFVVSCVLDAWELGTWADHPRRSASYPSCLMIALVCVVVVCTSRRVGRSYGVWCSGGASALSACTRLGAGGLSLAQGRVAGAMRIGTFGCVLWEAIDARDGSGRDRVYEERRCFAAFSVCKAFTFTAQVRGGAGRCFMPTSGVRPRCREASEGACHNQQAGCVGFHVRLHLRHSVGTSWA